MNFLIVFLLFLLRITSHVWAYSVVDCDFDTTPNFANRCGWAPEVVDTWLLVNRSTEKIDPGHDHTCAGRPVTMGSSQCGAWLTTKPPETFTDTQEFTLKSPQVAATVSPYCFTFWYHFFGIENAQFELLINTQSNTFNARTLFYKGSPQSNNWIQGMVTIPVQQTPFFLIFHARLNAKYHDTVGLDDITMNIGACPPTPECDLETDMCNWSTIGGNAVRTNGTPISDHTLGNKLGHFILNQGVGQKSQVTAPLKDMTARFSNNFYTYCLKFWYYFGYQKAAADVTSYLEVNITTYTFFSKRVSISSVLADGLTNAWVPFFATVPNIAESKDHNDSAILITMLSSAQSSFIAIDDLVLQNKPCESTGECDFEADFCGWTNQGDARWLRNQGGNQNGFKKAPSTDYSTHTPEGWFAMLPAEYLKNTNTYIATLTSPPLEYKSYQSCFSMAYYAVGSDRSAAIRMRFIDLTNYGNTIPNQMYTLNMSTFGFWQTFHTILPPKMPARFAISISTIYAVRSLTSDIAIDSIKLSGGECNNDRTVTPPPTTPIPYSERKWDCNFEYKCSQWDIDSNWRAISYRNVEQGINAPRSDKTYNTPEGKYLLWMPPAGLSPNQTQYISLINSTNITVSSNPIHCLSFWYYDASESLFSLDVLVRGTGFYSLSRTIRPTIVTRSWKLAKIDIRTYNLNSFIQLRFTTGTVMNGSFALDEFKIKPGECGHVDDYVYTMDTLDNLKLSQITPLNGKIGSIQSGTYVSSVYPNAPRRDHTTGTGGYFLFMNMASNVNVPLYKDELVLYDLPAMHYRMGGTQEQRCFRFAYQAVGNVTLEVYVESLNSVSYYYPRWSAFGAHDSWVVAQMPYNAYFDHKLVFQMTKPFDTTSYVALDDLQVSSHNCHQPVECDFDDDVCSYSSRYLKSDYEFARYVGPPLNNNWPGPAFDHTKRGYGGGYLYMTGFPSTLDMTRTSTVQTPVETFKYQAYGNYCLSFWTQLTQPDAVVTISLNLYGGTDKKDDTPSPMNSKSAIVSLLQLTNLTETKWTRHYVEVEKDVLTNFHEYNFIISGKTTQANTVIALDDIELAKTSCNFAVQFKCQNGGTQISADKVCDFRKDCADGSDESDCGECDFEKDWNACNWMNKSDSVLLGGTNNYQGAWAPVVASWGRNGGPTIDGNGNANGKYLILQHSSKDTATQSYFIQDTILTRQYRNFRNTYKDAYYTCVMTFDYFINSGRSYTGAVLRVLVGNDDDSAVLKFYTKSKSDTWQKGQARIGAFTGTFVVQFAGSAYGVNETVALDNIQFHNCSFPDPIASDATNCPSSDQLLCQTTRICIESGDLCDFEDNCGDNWDERYDLCSGSKANPQVPAPCAFEKSLELCGFEPEVPFNASDYNQFNWQYVRGYAYNMMSYSGPAADHTTKDKDGQFMTLRTYKKEFLGKSSRLMAPMVTSNGGDCIVRFFYFNDGNYSASTYNSLKVWAQFADGNKEDSGNLFVSNTYATGWTKAKVHFSSSAPFRFVFDGQLGSDTHGSISLDDVSFSSTCLRSDAKRTPGSHSSTALTVILVLLFVGFACGSSFFAYRKHKAGELEPFIRRLITAEKKTVPDTAAIVNPSFNNK